jgi:hypothetical protein
MDPSVCGSRCAALSARDPGVVPIPVIRSAMDKADDEDATGNIVVAADGVGDTNGAVKEVCVAPTSMERSRRDDAGVVSGLVARGADAARAWDAAENISKHSNLSVSKQLYRVCTAVASRAVALPCSRPARF